MNKVLLITVLAIIIIPALIFFAGRGLVASQEKEEIRKLKSFAADLSGQNYDERQLSGLPEPVRRYFKYALKDGQQYVSSVSLKHDGQFKTALDKEWIDIEGQQYFTAEKPGFLWKGKTALFSVRDMYIAGEGRIVIFLLSLFRLQEGTGENYDQGELLRWLGESVWFPTNLLPGPRLAWSAIDNDTAMLNFNYNGQELGYKVSFNAKGEITQLETRRHMGEDGAETWLGRVSDYKQVNSMMIPMRIEALWRLKGVEHSYARFNITEIEHD